MLLTLLIRIRQLPYLSRCQAGIIAMLVAGIVSSVAIDLRSQTLLVKPGKPIAPSAPQTVVESPITEYLSPFTIGARGDVLRNFHHTEANIFCCVECGQFSDGLGKGIGGGVFAELPVLLKEQLWLSLDVGYANRGGSFGEVVTGGLPILDPTTNKYVTLTRRHAYDATLSYLTLSFGPRVQPLKSIPVYLKGAFQMDLPLGASTTYAQTESILEPSGVFYPETNTRTRFVGQGEIPNLKTTYVVLGSLGIELPLGHNLTMSPEATYAYSLSTVEPLFNWKVSSFEAGLAFRWHIPHSAPPPLPPVAPSELARNAPSGTKPTAILGKPDVFIVSVATEPVKLVETIVTETFPILPYIFFDSASSTIAPRMQRIAGQSEVSRFDENNLPHKSLDAYRSILNVIGSRMKRLPEATLTLSGTTDGEEMKTRADVNELATSRAQGVKDYLTNVWNITPDRIVTNTLVRPTFPSSTEYREGYEENRRVELSSDNDALLKPIVHERFREVAISSAAIPFSLKAISSAGIRNWRLVMKAKGKEVYAVSGNGEPPPSYRWTLDDETAKRIAEQIKGSDSVDCELTAISQTDVRTTASTRVPAFVGLNPFELSRLSLIVFDFDNSSITDQNQRMISQFVAKAFFPSSTADITGSTDNLGELKHNQELSEARAINVHTLIVADKPDAKILSTKGIGPSRLLYDNSVPEGRYYCRTVTVEVETPLSEIRR